MLGRLRTEALRGIDIELEAPPLVAEGPFTGPARPPRCAAHTRGHPISATATRRMDDADETI